MVEQGKYAPEPSSALHGHAAISANALLILLPFQYHPCDHTHLLTKPSLGFPLFLFPKLRQSLWHLPSHLANLYMAGTSQDVVLSALLLVILILLQWSPPTLRL